MDQHLGSDQRPCWNRWRELVRPYIPSPGFTEDEDPAVGLYERLAGLRGRLSLSERAILSISLYKIRLGFEEKFESVSKIQPLYLYIKSCGVDAGEKDISDGLTKFAGHGSRVHEFCDEQGHPGIILVWSIPYNS